MSFRKRPPLTIPKILILSFSSSISFPPKENKPADHRLVNQVWIQSWLACRGSISVAGGERAGGPRDQYKVDPKGRQSSRWRDEVNEIQRDQFMSLIEEPPARNSRPHHATLRFLQPSSTPHYPELPPIHLPTQRNQNQLQSPKPTRTSWNSNR